MYNTYTVHVLRRYLCINVGKHARRTLLCTLTWTCLMRTLFITARSGFIIKDFYVFISSDECGCRGDVDGPLQLAKRNPGFRQVPVVFI